MDQRPEWVTTAARRPTDTTTTAPPGSGTVHPLYHGAPLASWGRRALAWIVDAIFGLLLSAPGAALLSIGIVVDRGFVKAILITIGAVLLLVGALVQIWQRGWRQGVTGQSWGKQVIRLHTVSANDLAPIGGPRGLLRWLIEALLGVVTILMILNYLWPLWDLRHQCWHDKVVGSVVLAR